MTKRRAADSPKVSVVSTTHNQEAYVRQTFDSFIAQQTEFPVEIIVADDASTDATPQIIQEYTDRHPHLFRPILRSHNLGLNANLSGALSAARGEYIALCEGDDYWVDPLKLSKQVALLDRNPKTAVCFHPVRVIWTRGRAEDEKLWHALYRKFEEVFLPKFPPPFWAGDRSFEVLIRRNFIQTNSVMYRRLPDYDDIPPNVMPLDWYLHVRHATHGDIAMLPETMAVYRRHPRGMWYKSITDPATFWLTQGLPHAATLDAMLDIVSGNPVHEQIIAKNANWVLQAIRKQVPDPEGRELLVQTTAQYPRITTLALKDRWARTPGGRLKRLRHKLRRAAQSKTGIGYAVDERLTV
ncbi:glycosyltransferase [Mycobacterium intracellulare]|uniref:glycosyltransferase n=1 Tax=Mycobacterium intracellulare TaxID=1767 RepID=UPI00080B5DBA|nr:glycosyltransferase [Mycobacterium intracellulare]OCB18786.1 sugar transferase [Mycobacterium intracellulare subsp. yongonense]